MPDLLLEFLSEEIPARMQARAAEDLKQNRDRPAGGGWPRLRRRQGLRHAAPARAVGARRAGAAARHQGRKERPARRRAAKRHCRVSQGGRFDVDRTGQGAARQEGRFLCGGHRQAGQAGARRAGRDNPRGGARLPVAEVDALGQWPARLGAPIALDPRHLRPGNRRPRRRQFQRRRHRGWRRDARPSLHGPWHVQGAPFRRLSNQSRGRQSGARSGAAGGNDSDRCQASGVCAGLRADRGRRLACRSRRPGGVAGDADGLVRRELPVDPGRGGPRYHPQ